MMGNLLALIIAVEASLFFKSTLPVTAYVVFVLALAAWQARSAKHLRWYREIRPLMVAQNAAVLAVVAAIAVGLVAIDNPVLNGGWYQVVAQNATGSTASSSTESPLRAGTPTASASISTTSNSPAPGGNIIAAPLEYPPLIAPFGLLLLFVLPQLAATEERIFREGTRTWRDGSVRSLVFGLAHMTAGVPLAVALALSVGGLWFTAQYFRGGVKRSTAYHLCYNLLVFAVIFAVLAVGAVTGSS